MLNEWAKIKYSDFSPVRLPELSKKDKKKFARDFICLDTETANNHDLDNPVGWIYQWCFSYQNALIYGRTPTQLMECLLKISRINEGQKVLIFVHNLSYDFSYIWEYLKASFEKTEFLAVNSHKVISVVCDNLEFRCTYKLTQKSLAKWTKDMGTKHKKLVGEIDYNIIRYQDTPLFRKDWRYMFYDVVVLHECITAQMALYCDSVKTIPLTSTGYVRREVRNEFKKDKKYRRDFKNSRLSEYQYKLCCNAFSGGLTHGNRFYAEKTLHGNIKHRDFVSHYPTQQRCYTFPVGRFFEYYNILKNKYPIELDSVLKLSERFCYLITINVTELKVKQGVTLPTAQAYKFYIGKIDYPEKTIEDNGRLLYFKGNTIITLVDSDFEILCRQYSMTFKILEIQTAVRGKCPKFVQNSVDRFFYNKTHFKKQYELSKNRDDYLMLMIAKGGLNGIYGMTATKIIREEWTESEGEWKIKPLNSDDIQSQLDKYYNGFNNFNSYQLGVWTTANARKELIEFTELIGYDKFIYADTDSIFYFSNDETEKKIENKNAELRATAEREKCYIEIDGKKQYYNEFKLENENITDFRFLHSKCYAYITDNTDLHCTIAGVSAVSDEGITREKELKSIDNLKHNFIFEKCGGTKIKYFYNPPTTAEIDGHITEYSAGAIITDNIKTLNGVIASQEYFFDWSVD